MGWRAVCASLLLLLLLRAHLFVYKWPNVRMPTPRVRPRAAQSLCFGCACTSRVRFGGTARLGMAERKATFARTRYDDCMNCARVVRRLVCVGEGCSRNDWQGRDRTTRLLKSTRRLCGGKYLSTYVLCLHLYRRNMFATHAHTADSMQRNPYNVISIPNGARAIAFRPGRARTCANQLNRNQSKATRRASAINIVSL